MSRPVGRRRDAAGLRFNVSTRQLKYAIELLRRCPDSAAAVERGEARLFPALQLVKRKDQQRAIEATTPPEGKYRTLVVDPPWAYDKSFGPSAAASKYATMPDDEVLALKVGDLSADECHLFLWTTGPKLPVAFKALEAWSFRYVSPLVWRKQQLGLGTYFRSQTEFVLFAVRGNAPLRRQDASNVIEAPVGTHSTKPRAFFDLVESTSYEPRMELFARGQRPGWTCWGAEAVGTRGPAIHKEGADIKGPYASKGGTS